MHLKTILLFIIDESFIGPCEEPDCNPEYNLNIPCFVACNIPLCSSI